MTRAEEKRALRRTMAGIEAALSPRILQETGAAIIRRLMSLPEYQSAGTVCCFVGTRREIDTRPLLEDALRSGKRLCVPLCLGPGEMEMRQITALSELRPGAMRIPEPPAEAPLVEEDAIDFTVIPCLACSREGARLGRGGGYYDRFLARYRGAAVMVCREALLRQEIPLEPHDIPVHWVVTERALYEDGVPSPLF